MKRTGFVISAVCAVCVLCQGCRHRTQSRPQTEVEYPLALSEIRIRDPFVLVDPNDSTYYIHANNRNSFICYSSKDLHRWKKCGVSFEPSPDFWGKQEFWAPKAYLYKGKYYLFASFYSEEYSRGISVLVSDSPDKGFQPLNNFPLTPRGWMCLDGSLYIDREGNPWLIYAREWLEVEIGEVYAQRLTDDLKQPAGDPIYLFKGSDADWPGLIMTGDRTGIVTNSPFIVSTESGSLLMIWSSFMTNGEYAIGVAVSRSGRLQGPWEQRSGAINDDGGHAMIFRDFGGSLMISYHNNEPPIQVIMRPITIQQDEIIFLN